VKPYQRPAVNPEWSRRLKALQRALGLDNPGMAARFGVSQICYQAWKYRRRNMGSSAIRLLEMFEAKAKKKIVTGYAN
jgi:DNA-binding transcriptional regulator YiaG